MILLILNGCSINNQSNKKVITISAAASLKDALTEIEKQYEKKYKNVDLKFNFGASGALSQQIKSGAPVDLFISAAENKVDDLEAAKLVRKDERKTLLKNHLVVVSNKKKINDLSDLKDSNIEKIAIGNPDLVPAGSYGKEALEKSGLYNQIKDKLVLTKDVRQVLTYVETGNVEAGIVYVSDKQSSKKVKYSFEIEDTLHGQITYPIAIIKDTKHKNQVLELYEYLQKEEAKKIFKANGFDVLK